MTYFQVENSYCNCSKYDLNIKSFTLNYFNIESFRLLFTDTLSKHVISADKNGCICKPSNLNEFFEKNSPINSFKLDSENLYMSSDNNFYHKSFKADINNSLCYEIGIKEFLIFGSHMQLYPPLKCLKPMPNQSATAQLKSFTATSITLLLPTPLKNNGCKNTSMPLTKYHIYYKLYSNFSNNDCDNNCLYQTTYNRTIKIKNLRPYSKYVFYIGLGNYFSKEENIYLLHLPSIFETAPGGRYKNLVKEKYRYQAINNVSAPSKPLNVTATVLSPTLVRVKWLPPKEINGENVKYELHWQTEGKVIGIRQKGEQKITNYETDSSGYLQTYLQKLSPNECFSIWIRAYTRNNETSCDSDKVIVTMFPEPDNVILLANTSNSLKIQWKTSSYVENFVLQFCEITSNAWQNITDLESEKEEFINFHIKYLEPKTQYKFRLLLNYFNYDQSYIWPKDMYFMFETLGNKIYDNFNINIY